MKFFYKAKLPEAYARCEWCRMHLGKAVKGGNWWRHRGHLYFKDEKSYLMYILKWGTV
jgi:hypothetical protein